jgi:hypothetical protein
MNNQYPFYGGEPNELGIVSALPLRNFREFVERKLLIACTLNTTRDQYEALPQKDRQRIKRVPYVVPCCFQETPSRRVFDQATHYNLICLDIDLVMEKVKGKSTGKVLSIPAAPYYNSPETLYELLAPFNFAAYTTASSTPAEPKMRIMVEAAGLAPSTYRVAVQFIARCIGLTDITTESFTMVQPMFLPTIFSGDDEENEHPLLCYDLDGRAVTAKDLKEVFGDAAVEADQGKPRPHANSLEDASGNALEYLRPVVEEIGIRDVVEALECLDPDMTYPDWLEVAAAMKHQFGGGEEDAEAYAAFDAWSATGEKYGGKADTLAKWDSLRPHPSGRAPVTIRTLLTKATLAGWASNSTREKCFAATVRWIRDPERSSSELISQGAGKILGTPLITKAEEEALLSSVATELRTRFGLKVTTSSLRKDMNDLKAKAEGAKDQAKKRLVPAWAKGLCYVATVNQFFRHSTGELFIPDAIDNTYGRKLLPTEDQLAAALAQGKPLDASKPYIRPRDYLLNTVKVPTVFDFAYDPRQPNDTFITNANRPCVNLYVPGYPEANPKDAQYASIIFLTHLKHLIAEAAYRTVVMDFLAHLVQFPGKKIRWAILLQGVEGCGKTFLAEAMRAVLGYRHVRAIDSNAIHGQWNEWAYGAQLITLEEIRVAGQSRHEVMNALKPLITNDQITINQRNRDTRQVENTANYLLFTNHHDSLVLSHGDRRYFILKSPLQTKKQVKDLGHHYFRDLFSMLSTHGAGLRYWFENWSISKEFDADGHAPRTEYLQQLLNDTANDALIQIREAISDNVHPLVTHRVLSSTALMGYLQTHMPHKDVPSIQHLGAMLRDEGYNFRKRIEINATRHNLWVRLGTEPPKDIVKWARDTMFDWNEIDPDDLALL